MKHLIILWISSSILTFLIGFFQSRTSDVYPISGTIGIDGQKISYHFKKVQGNDENYKILIRTDLTKITGVLTWQKMDNVSSWEIDTLKNENGILFGSIPKQDPQTKLKYKVFLYYNSMKYVLPTTHNVELLFVGSVPMSISIHYYLTLFLGLLLSIRTGLETFNEKPRLRLYSIFTLIVFISCALIFAPVKKAYELGAINKMVPALSELFAGWLTLLAIIWIGNLILVSYSPYRKWWARIASILTPIIFISQNF